MNLQQRDAPAPRRYRRALIRRHFHTLPRAFHARSRSIPRSGGVARHESCRKLRCPSHVLTVPVNCNTRLINPEILSIVPTPRNPMTLIQIPTEEKEAVMNGKTQTKEDSGKSLRPVRNRRYTRRSLVAGHRPQKRLFTPEIKRYLKDWLVRRRENPYPNRDEKKNLAQETGLTYIQICNWFANWRRKLKNVNIDRNQQTWGHLIRTYNDRAQGNVEQFSICSDDSIWSETDHTSAGDSLDIHLSYANSPEPIADYQRDPSDSSSVSKEKCDSFNNNLYSAEHEIVSHDESKSLTSPLLLSKWLESAARFQPSETNYSWWADGKRRKPEKIEAKIQKVTLNASRHGQDEVEAAVALTALAGATVRIAAP